MESLEMYNMTQYYKGTFNLARTLDNTPTVTVNVTAKYTNNSRRLHTKDSYT